MMINSKSDMKGMIIVSISSSIDIKLFDKYNTDNFIGRSLIPYKIMVGNYLMKKKYYIFLLAMMIIMIGKWKNALLMS